MAKVTKVATLQPRVQMATIGTATTQGTLGWQSDRRASRHARGYGTAWDRLRKAILERDYHLCQCQHCLGGVIRVRPAHAVDHIISKAEWQITRSSTLEGCDNPSNLQAINEDCHTRKTAEDLRRVNRLRGGVL